MKSDMNWIENAHEAMAAEPSFWLWGSKLGMGDMPVVVYGLDKPYINRPHPQRYSYVVLPQERICP
jgi:hypothetical protein